MTICGNSIYRKVFEPPLVRIWCANRNGIQKVLEIVTSHRSESRTCVKQRWNILIIRLFGIDILYGAPCFGKGVTEVVWDSSSEKSCDGFGPRVLRHLG